METQEKLTPLKDFIERCQKDLGFEAKITPKGEEEHTYLVELPEALRGRDNLGAIHARQYSLLGLIAHFKNRKWIKDYGYVYIHKSVYVVTFYPDFKLSD